MSLRIDRVVGDRVVLSVSGRITHRDLDTLRNAIGVEASPIAINLENVELVDREVVKYLAQIELSGAVLRNCSAYIREWITRERAEVIKKTEDTEDA